MADSENTCPDPHLLSQVLEGTASEDVFELVESHLGECPDCARRLESIVPQCLTILERMRRMKADQAAPSWESGLELTAEKIQIRIRNPETIGPYRVIRKIGQGAMGEVFECQDDRLHRRVAVKTIIRPDHSEDLSKRITTEARLLAGLNHPNIVTIHDFGFSEDGLPYLVMELVEGETLKRRIRKSRLSANQAAALTRDCALAIAYAHECGVLHRDLKPSNILLARQQAIGSRAECDTFGAIAKIADFGLAKSLEDDLQASHTGSVLGTPAYLAPETIHKGAAVGPSADIYALGIVLYECLAGEPPFKAGTFAALVNEIEHASPDFERIESRTSLADLRTIIEKCLEKRPADRYLTARELASDLDLYLAGRPILAKPVPLSGQLVRWCRRNALAATALAAVMISLLLIASISVVFSLKQRALRREAEGLILEAGIQRDLANQSNRSMRSMNQFAQSQRDVALESLDESSDALFEALMTLNTPETKSLESVREARAAIAAKIIDISDRIRQVEGYDLLDTTYQIDLHERLAYVRTAMAQHKEAVQQFEEALRLYETLPAEIQESGPMVVRRIEWASLLGDSLTALGDSSGARAAWRKAWNRFSGNHGTAARTDPNSLTVLVAVGEKLADAEMKYGQADDSARIRSELDSLKKRSNERTRLDESAKRNEFEPADSEAPQAGPKTPRCDPFPEMRT
ncbi:protein kinase [bacterium]|nr:protein kinase [bacterium]